MKSHIRPLLALTVIGLAVAGLDAHFVLAQEEPLPSLRSLGQTSTSSDSEPKIVPESDKSPEQKRYEEMAKKRLAHASETIGEIKKAYENLDDRKKREIDSSLRTAEGNRHVARIKLKQLRYIHPLQWTSLTAGIDNSLLDLERVVSALEKKLNDLNSP